MSKKTTLSIAGLIILAGIMFYLCVPKYDVYIIEDVAMFRFNKVWGIVEFTYDGTNWRVYGGGIDFKREK